MYLHSLVICFASSQEKLSHRQYESDSNNPSSATTNLGTRQKYYSTVDTQPCNHELADAAGLRLDYITKKSLPALAKLKVTQEGIF